MNSAASLPENVLSKMRPQDRAKLGVQSADEAMAEFTAKNERELQNQIASFLNLRGIPFYRSRMDRKTTGTVGWPDFTLAINGRPIAFETKFGKGALSKEQTDCHLRMTANGWDVFVIRHFDEAMKLIVNYLAVPYYTPP